MPELKHLRQNRLTPSRYPPHIPANDDDDSFSPAHDAEDIGTGVNEDDGSEGEATATTDTETVVDNNDAADEEKELKS